MNSIARIELHILTSCLIHEDLKFGPWYKVSTWMTLWAIIKIPWDKGFSKVLIACRTGMLLGHTDLTWSDYSLCLTTAKCGSEMKGLCQFAKELMLEKLDAFLPLLSVWVIFFLTRQDGKKKQLQFSFRLYLEGWWKLRFVLMGMKNTSLSIFCPVTCNTNESQ